ncbi:MAG TPA: hypothetical protein VKT81_08570 [Bryobacteraceae bacterium]|nr:hypothetical protein [Bryobacteraceae bacterium]
MFICFTILLLGRPLLAQGYVDPGSGALIWQILAAGFVGAVYVFRKFIVKWFRRFKSHDPE